MSWLKFDTDTPEKPEVLAITALMGWTDPDLTVGKLFKVWRWFDKQTLDGNARNVTCALLNHVIGVPGFAEAMAVAGWLEVDEAGLSLPKFDRHNGQTAKDRALTAQRVAKSKAKTKGGNAATVTTSVSGALPREEKRREEQQHGNETVKRSPADAGPPADQVGSFEGQAERPTTPEVRERIAVVGTLRRLGINGATSMSDDLRAYIAAGGNAAHVEEVATFDRCRGKGALYVLRAATSDLTERAPIPQSAVVTADGTALVPMHARGSPQAAPSKRAQALQVLEGMKR